MIRTRGAILSFFSFLPIVGLYEADASLPAVVLANLNLANNLLPLTFHLSSFASFLLILRILSNNSNYIGAPGINDR